MNGILNVIKPPGMTSFDVVAHLRGLLVTRKIGHTVTLDPLAVGVLPVCAGNATRAIEFLMEKDKHYRAELTLGITTDTQDAAGAVISSREPACTDEEIKAAAASFTGRYPQLPPMYSALRVEGKRLYELARSGVEIDRQPRDVAVHSITVLDIERTDRVKVLLDIHCSKGTYIRTLCADIGDRLGCGGHMSFLLRKQAGPFHISEAFTLEELSRRKSDGTLQGALSGVETVFEDYAALTLDEGADRKFRNGVPVPIAPDGRRNGELMRVYNPEGVFAALGTVKKSEDGTYLKVKKFF